MTTETTMTATAQFETLTDQLIKADPSNADRINSLLWGRDDNERFATLWQHYIEGRADDATRLEDEAADAVALIEARFGS